MSRTFDLKRLAGLAALALVLAVAPACNNHDDPGQAESVVLVTSVTTTGLSTAAATDTTATISYTVNPRSSGATGFYNAVTLTNYSVSFSATPPSPVSGVISTGFCPIGGSCAVVLTLVPNGGKPASGTTVIADVDIDGKDSNDNPVHFSATVPLTFVP
jgi:hypothetical protein